MRHISIPIMLSIIGLAALNLIVHTYRPAHAQDATPVAAPDTSATKKISRAEQFEALRVDRTKVLQQIQEKTQRLIAIDRELPLLRDQLREKFDKAPTPPLLMPFTKQQIETALDRMRLDKEAAEKNLTSRKEELKKAGKSEAEIGLDGSVIDFDTRIKQIDISIKEAEQRQKDLEESLKAQQEEQSKTARAFEAQKKETQERITALGTEQEQLQKDLAKLNIQLDDINFRARRLIDISDAEGNFRFNTSWVFAALVGVVILGFFWIARSDNRVRYAIFANDSGIQFITLFSIVIAVILFGIIGVLEGKELSALLGGLSGYILGRHAATQTRRGAGDQEGTTDGQPAPTRVSPVKRRR